MTSYVDFAPYLNSFSTIETHLMNFTNDLTFPDVIDYFHDTDTT